MICEEKDMNEGKPMVLGFALDEKQRAGIRMLCIRLGLRYRPVETSEYGQMLSALCGEGDPIEGAVSPGPLEEPMLLFAHMADRQVGDFLSGCKQARLSRPSLLAILTETNRTWTPHELQRELSAEREVVRAKMQSIHASHSHAHPHSDDKKEKP